MFEKHIVDWTQAMFKPDYSAAETSHNNNFCMSPGRFLHFPDIKIVDQRRLICAFVVRLQQSQILYRQCPLVWTVSRKKPLFDVYNPVCPAT